MAATQSNSSRLANNLYVIGDDSITAFTKADSGEVTGVKITGSNGSSTLTKVK